MLLAGAGGLAVGAVGGALIADALDDSDPEVHNHYYNSAPPEPAPAPVEESSSSSSSSSSSDEEEYDDE